MQQRQRAEGRSGVSASGGRWRAVAIEVAKGGACRVAEAVGHAVEIARGDKVQTADPVVDVQLVRGGEAHRTVGAMVTGVSNEEIRIAVVVDAAIRE